MQLTGSAPDWRKSTRCGPDNGCVEIARLGETSHIAVRDSKNVATSPVLAFERDEWSRFASSIKAGELDLS